MKIIPRHEIEFVTATGDPMGRTFRWQGGIFRAIYVDKVNYVNVLFSSGLIDRLINKQLLIPTEVTNYQLEGFGLVLRHKLIAYPTKSMFWPRTVLLDAAKLVVDLNLELLPYSLGTIDYHTQNIFLDIDSKPIWTDLGSIVPINKEHVAEIPKEFIEYILNPLLMYCQNADVSFACRQLLMKEYITTEELIALMGLKIEHEPNTRENWLKSIKKWLEAVSFPTKHTTWTEYYTKKEDFKLQSEKIEYAYETREGIVQSLIRTYKPKNIIDIACNAGAFSCIAAFEGIPVCALDRDESAIELFYSQLKKQGLNLPITLSVMDIDYWYTQRISPIQAEMVLAMAITHHLSLSQRLPFHRIAWLLSSYTTNILITEFMPKGLGIDRVIPNPLPDFYTLESLMNSFSPYFRSVDIVGPKEGHRIIICCKGRNSIIWAGHE